MRKKIWGILATFGISVLISQIASAAEFRVKRFDYQELEKQEISACDAVANTQIEQIYGEIQHFQSEQAVELSDLLVKQQPCLKAYDIQAWAYFRNGKWEEALSFINTAIETFGAYLEFIYTRAYMCLEMAELGIGVRHVDGNAVYSVKYFDGKYNEQQFTQECFQAALDDFLYLNQHDSQDEFKFMIGYLYQQLEDYQQSSAFLTQIEDKARFGKDVQMLLIENLISLRQYKEAEQTLLQMYPRYPHDPDIVQRLSQFYELTGNEEEQAFWEKRYDFSLWVPEFIDLSYSEETFDLLKLFHSSQTQAKLEKVEQLAMAEQEYAIKIYMAVLYAHVNHDNGVEEAIVEKLISFGSPVVPYMIQLLGYPKQSTCTLSNAAYILSEVKDPRGWEPLVESLAYMERFPSTIIPPNIPEALINYDQIDGMNVLLDRLQQNNLRYRYFYLLALKDIDAHVIRKYGTVFFTEQELQALLEEIEEIKQDYQAE